MSKLSLDTLAALYCIYMTLFINRMMSSIFWFDTSRDPLTLLMVMRVRQVNPAWYWSHPVQVPQMQ